MPRKKKTKATPVSWKKLSPEGIKELARILERNPKQIFPFALSYLVSQEPLARSHKELLHGQIMVLVFESTQKQALNPKLEMGIDLLESAEKHPLLVFTGLESFCQKTRKEAIKKVNHILKDLGISDQKIPPLPQKPKALPSAKIRQ